MSDCPKQSTIFRSYSCVASLLSRCRSEHTGERASGRLRIGGTMNRLVRVSILVFGVLAATLCAQAQMVNVTVRIILVDRDLNQKPVPSFRVSLQRTDAAAE